MEPLATLADLKARLDWTLDADEERSAAGALEDASDMARHYGTDWQTGAEPRMARTLVLKAVIRYMRNPDGYTQSRAGDETLVWNDSAGEDAGTVHFTQEEQDLLRGLAGKSSGLYSAPVSAWNSRRRPECDIGYVPSTSGKPFPMFPTQDGPW